MTVFVLEWIIMEETRDDKCDRILKTISCENNVFKYSRQTQCQQIICFDFEIFIQNLVEGKRRRRRIIFW